MLRIFVAKSGARAKEYFKNELSKGDYYSQNQQIVGLWGGKAALELGLSGEVVQKEFDSLVDNLHPATGEKLTKHLRSNRRVGFDFTFNAPKSLSLIYELSTDIERKKLLKLYREAVTETMTDIEAATAARVRKNGANTDRTTGNMAFAEFVHFTARPVDGVPEPHLHSHMFVINVTKDTVEDQWKAVELGEIKADAPYYEAAFHARLTKKLVAAGYGIEARGRFWEIAGIKRDTVLKFSSRTIEIEELAKSYGITNDRAKSRLAALTRKHKNGELSLRELREIWALRLTEEEHQDIAQSKNGKFKPTTAKQAVDYALNHHLERQSTIKESRLIEEAQRTAFGSLIPKDIEAELKRRIDKGELIKRKNVNTWFITTREILQQEHDIIEYTKTGYGIAKKLNPNHTIKRDYLGREQRDAIQHVLTSRDVVIAIQGKPGVGKSTIMKETIEAIEAAGTPVYSFAPSTDAAENIRKDGIKGETTAKLLATKKLIDQITNSVIWIDEAGLMSVNDMNQVFKIAKEKNARVVLSGDIKQHNSVQRGDAYRILQVHAELKPAVISKIRRQSGEYKEAVRLISSGHLKLGYDKLDEIEAIIEIEDSADRYKQLAKEYVEKSIHNSVLAISPSHKEGEQVATAIRNEMIDKALISGTGKLFTIFENKKFTQAERETAQYYEPGMVVKYHRAVQTDRTRIKQGARFEVENIDNGNVVIKNQLGNTQTLDLTTSTHFDVYESKNIDLQKGDIIRITENGQSVDRKHRLNNGAIYKVAGFTKDNNISLENGWVVDAKRGNFKYGYVLTSQNSQSKGEDYVLIAQSSESYGAGSAEQFNVSTSRGKKGIRYYTDDKEGLFEMIEKSTKRLSAVELLDQSQARSRAEVENTVEHIRSHTELLNRQSQQTQQTTPHIKQLPITTGAIIGLNRP